MAADPQEWINQFRLKQYELGFQFIVHMITLATVVIGLSITFTKDIVKNNSGRGSRFLKAAWVALLISILFGLIAMAAMVMFVYIIIEAEADGGSFASNIRHYAFAPAILQLVSFLSGILLLILSGASSLAKPANTPEVRQ